MEREPLVSILCTAFQQEAYIGQALDSFLMQRLDAPFEVIVHDDASKDRTAEIIRSYQERHPEIIKPIFQTVNQFTTAPGRITRLVNEAAKGKYIALCEGDDHWTDPLKLQKQVDVMEADGSVAGVFHYTEQRFEGMQGKGRLFGDHQGKLRFTVEDTFSAYALCHNAAFMYRRSAYQVPEWYGKVKSGDMVLFSIVAGSGDLVCIPEVMSVYRKHPGGVTLDHGAGIQFHRDRLELLDRLHAHHGGRFNERLAQVKQIHLDEIGRLQRAAGHRPGPWRAIKNKVRSILRPGDQA